MRKITLGLMAIAAAVPALPTAALAQDWGRGRYERDYRSGGGYDQRYGGVYDQRYGGYDSRTRGGYDNRYSGYDSQYNDDRYANYYDGRGYYHGPTWRGNDGRSYCRRADGTTGLVVGGIAGALIGRSIDSRGDRATGTLLGGAIGALLGRAVEKDGARCR